MWPIGFLYLHLSFLILPETGSSIAYSFVYIIFFLFEQDLSSIKPVFTEDETKFGVLNLHLNMTKSILPGQLKKILWFWIFFNLTLHGVQYFPYLLIESVFNFFLISADNMRIILSSYVAGRGSYYNAVPLSVSNDTNIKTHCLFLSTYFLNKS